MKKDAAITIFMPARNESNYIHETIKSLLSQSFGDFNLIVSDNHSTDLTREVARSFELVDPRVTVIAPPAAMSALEHFNFGRTFFKSDFCAYAGSHDIYHPDYLAECYSALCANKKAVIAHSKCLHFDSHGNFFKIPSLNFNSDGLSSFEKVFIYLMGVRYNNLAYGLYRRDMMSNVVIPAVLGCDHLETVYHLLNGDVVTVDKELIYFRYPENSADCKRQINSIGSMDGEAGWRSLMIELNRMMVNNFSGLQLIHGLELIKNIYLSKYSYMFEQLGLDYASAKFIADEVLSEVQMGFVLNALPEYY